MSIGKNIRGINFGAAAVALLIGASAGIHAAVASGQTSPKQIVSAAGSGAVAGVTTWALPTLKQDGPNLLSSIVSSVKSHFTPAPPASDGVVLPDRPVVGAPAPDAPAAPVSTPAPTDTPAPATASPAPPVPPPSASDIAAAAALLRSAGVKVGEG